MHDKKNEDIEDQVRAYRGMIPWSVKEYDWIISTYGDRRNNKEENLQLSEKFADFKDEMVNLKGKEIENIQSMILFDDIFHHRYRNEIEYMAHFFRFHQINRFLQTYHTELAKLKFVAVIKGDRHIEPKLIDSLCTLPYSLEGEDESGEISCTFLYSEVIAATKAKMNAHLN